MHAVGWTKRGREENDHFCGSALFSVDGRPIQKSCISSVHRFRLCRYCLPSLSRIVVCFIHVYDDFWFPCDWFWCCSKSLLRLCGMLNCELLLLNWCFTTYLTLKSCVAVAYLLTMMTYVHEYRCAVCFINNSAARLLSFRSCAVCILSSLTLYLITCSWTVLLLPSSHYRDVIDKRNAVLASIEVLAPRPLCVLLLNCEWGKAAIVLCIYQSNDLSLSPVASSISSCWVPLVLLTNTSGFV